MRWEGGLGGNPCQIRSREFAKDEKRRDKKPLTKLVRLVGDVTRAAAMSNDQSRKRTALRAGQEDREPNELSVHPQEVAVTDLCIVCDKPTTPRQRTRQGKPAHLLCQMQLDPAERHPRLPTYSAADPRDEDGVTP